MRPKSYLCRRSRRWAPRAQAIYRNSAKLTRNLLPSCPLTFRELSLNLEIDWEKEILKTYDPKSAKTDAGKMLRLNGNVTRVFNEKWLASSDALFILSGVVNRIDRRDFDPDPLRRTAFYLPARLRSRNERQNVFLPHALHREYGL